MKKHLDDSDRKGIQKNSCASGDLDQVSSVNVADRHFPDLRGTVNPFDSPRAASHDFDDSDRKGIQEDSCASGSMDQVSSVNVADGISLDWHGAEVPRVPDELLQNNEPLRAYQWVPLRGEFWCRLCHRFATGEHTNSARHIHRS